MSASEYIDMPAADVVLPFALERANARGRFVRVGPVAREVIRRHAYPDPVAALLAEAIALGGALSSFLKFDGVFTLQIKGDGPVRMLVVDITSAGEIRGYAQFDTDRMPALTDDSKHPFKALVGDGYLAFTVDQSANTDRYQGIVELQDDSFAACLQHYFAQSEQLDTMLVSAVDVDADGWGAGAIMMQRIPVQGGIQGDACPDDNSEITQAWQEAKVLLGSVKREELAQPTLGGLRVLYCLFHQQTIKAAPYARLAFGCRCSPERIKAVLATVSRAELEELKDDGVVKVTCAFCNEDFKFDDAALDAIAVEAQAAAASAG
jgi:molecular chaperone Hsp33